MISEERQGELMADLEYSVNKYLNNQGILDIAIGDGCNTGGRGRVSTFVFLLLLCYATGG